MSRVEATKPNHLLAKLFRAANRVVRPLLTSPLHGVLSKSLMLLTYTGRKSGRRVTIPIAYVDWEPGVVLGVSSHERWMPNLRTGATVQLRISGRDHDAVPTVVDDPIERTEALAELARRQPGRVKMLGLPTDRTPTAEEVHAASLTNCPVLFRLTP